MSANASTNLKPVYWHGGNTRLATEVKGKRISP